MKDKKRCEEGNIKCNKENVPKRHIIHSDQINIGNIDIKYHTNADHIKHHMKIHTKKSISLLSVYQKIHLQEPHEESC